MFVDNDFFITEEEFLADNSLNEALEDLNQLSELSSDYHSYLCEQSIICIQLEGRAFINEDHEMLNELNAAFRQKIKNGVKLFLSKFKGLIPSICAKIKGALQRLGTAIRGKVSQFLAWVKKAKIIKGGKKVAESFDELYYDGYFFNEADDKDILFTRTSKGALNTINVNNYTTTAKQGYIMLSDKGFMTIDKNYAELFKLLKEVDPKKVTPDNLEELQQILRTSKDLVAKNQGTDPREIISDVVKNLNKYVAQTDKAEKETVKAVNDAEKKVEEEAKKDEQIGGSTASTDSGGDKEDEKKKSGGGFFAAIGSFFGAIFGFIRDIFMGIVNTIRGIFSSIAGFFTGGKKEDKKAAEGEEKKEGSAEAKSGESNAGNKEEKKKIVEA